MLDLTTMDIFQGKILLFVNEMLNARCDHWHFEGKIMLIVNKILDATFDHC